MSKPRENKNGAGNPRTAKKQKNFDRNLNLHKMKEAHHGLGQRQVRRNLMRASGLLPYTATTPVPYESLADVEDQIVEK